MYEIDIKRGDTMELGLLMKYLYPNLEPFKDYLVMDKGEGHILEWNTDSPKPTIEELQKAWEEYQVNLPVEPLSEIESLKKTITDLSFELMMKGVL